ncbi:MAG: hypothetical protein WCS94_17355 [Verrucomicrobiota bacterium]
MKKLLVSTGVRLVMVYALNRLIVVIRCERLSPATPMSYAGNVYE